MRKISLLLCLAILFACTACTPKTEDNKESEQINAFLEEGNFVEAYETATDRSTRDKIIAENFAAYASASVDTAELSLEGCAFGQATADESDLYTPNDPIFAMENYQKLAEYMSLLTGNDLLNDYYYSVIKLGEADTTWNILYSIKIDGCEIQLINMWESLNMTSQDSNAIAFYKYIAKKVLDEGTTLESAAINRVGNKYLSSDVEQVSFKYDLSNNAS